jgi:Zn-dependent metalloprotease
MAALALAAALPAIAFAAAPAAAADGNAAERALKHIADHAKAARYGADQAFEVRDVVVDANGADHVRFDRTYRGLRVIGGDLVVHESRDGSYAGISKDLAADLTLSSGARVSRGEALREVVSHLFGTQIRGVDGDLVVYARSEPTLAYEIVVTGTKLDDTETELHVILDASDASILDTWDAIETASGSGNSFFSGTVPLETTPISGGYRLKDPLRGGNYTCDMRNRTSSCVNIDDADNLWGNGLLTDKATIAVDAQYGTATTWDYYKLVHGRNGIANDGKGAYNRVHYSSKYNNAFWSDSCFCMTYGDGDGVTYNPFDSLDVAGHEMSHGVTSRTSKLIYSGESGGLNEATSDIFGTMVEYYAQNARDTPDFKIGEKLYKTNPSEAKALRYMWQPSLDGKSADCWSSTVGSLDVHYSSGVANHFFYLLSQGSNGSPASPTCNGSTVAGIGNSAAEKIWYRALTVYMTSNTNYKGARTATLSAATDLFGAGSAQYAATNAAWAAVSVTA